ncbi:hypothetical protein D3C78_395190 [compost metagenome]
MFNGQGLAIGLWRGQGEFEGAVAGHLDAAQHSAVGAAHDHRGTRFASAGNGGAAVVDARVADNLRWGAVGGGEVDRAGTVAEIVGGLHGEAFAVALWRVEGDIEAPVGADCRGAQHGTVRRTYRDDRATLALPGEVQACAVDGQPGRLQWAVQVRRGQGCGRGIARSVTQHHVEHLAIGLGRCEGEGEDAVRADHCSAQHRALGIAHLHAGPGFTAASEGSAIGAQLQVTGRVRRGDIRCTDLGRQRAVAVGVQGHHIEQLTIGLSGVEADGEVAIIAHLHAAQHIALCIAHLHQAASRSGAADGRAIGGYHHPGGAFRDGGLWHDDAELRRRIAGSIGLYQHDAFARSHWSIQFDQEGAIGCHGATADHIAVGIQHLHCGTRFTAARYHDAAGAHHHAGDEARGSNVRGGISQWCGAVAGGIGDCDGQGFTVGLGRVEGEAEAAVRPDDSAADQGSGGVAHLHPCTGFGIAGQRLTIAQRQPGRLPGGYQVRCRQRACR